MSRISSLYLVLLLVFGGHLSASAPEPLPRIALGSFGKEDFGAWFRLLVEDELTSAGFTVVMENDHPDAVLDGVIVHPNQVFYAYGLLRLSLPNGEIPWRHRSWNDHITDEAAKIVKELKEAIKEGKLRIGRAQLAQAK